MTEEENCFFCKIARKENPSFTVYEDDHAAAFLDVYPRSPGHTLIIPKVHASTFMELPEEEIGPLFLAVRRVAEMLINALHCDGATIGINHGEASGQVVSHLHVHIIPRYAGDGGGAIQSVVEYADGATLRETVEKIKHTSE